MLSKFNILAFQLWLCTYTWIEFARQTGRTCQILEQISPDTSEPTRWIPGAIICQGIFGLVALTFHARYAPHASFNDRVIPNTEISIKIIKWQNILWKTSTKCFRLSYFKEVSCVSNATNSFKFCLSFTHLNTYTLFLSICFNSSV